MGYVFVMGNCITCGAPLLFNPARVPSIRVRHTPGGLVVDPTAPKEPICRTCIEKANVRREEMGLPPHPIREDAYQPAPEEEVF
jgi:hypothetical protein